MSGYEVEHNITAERADASSSTRRHMPDLDTFFSRLDQVDTTGTRVPQNHNSVPTPGDVSATFRLLADAYAVMLRDEGANPVTATGGNENLLVQLVEQLRDTAEHPPRELQGVPDEFLDELERVPKKRLREADSCPICSEPFLNDQYPLVVRLPCHKDHLFDYECIRPWLKLNPTCPLDRQTLLKKKAPPPPPDEEDGEYDDMFA
ncbi:hypothetical protein AAFC00_000531 [Neodothiora populina]|uniref:RING-type domain-containing protein n=1 Tax=Neodothiora populina TaxID=2781224 RepID=A0ABR3PD88_9PEZI